MSPLPLLPPFPVDILLTSSGAIIHRIRAPTADLPTTAALLGGFVAQEAIKLITRQYVPINGVCVIDLISSTTGTIKI
jgi:NEDD8-activating enzyme E1 regulatory subunit